MPATTVELPGEVPVLIVGGGPVGLALANELGWRGVDYLLVDDNDEEVVFPAGENIFSRTMEHIRRWGFSDEVRQDPEFPADYPRTIAFATALDGRIVALFPGTSNRDAKVQSRVSPEGMVFCPKRAFDPALRRGAKRAGTGMLLNRLRLVGFEDRQHEVIARLLDLRTGAEHVVRAAYLAACDGARSLVRKSLGISFVGSFAQGHNFAIYLRAPTLQAILLERFGQPIAQIQTINTANRPYLTAVDGRLDWRLSMYVGPDATPDPAEAVRNAIGTNIPFEVLRAQPWAGHRVVAESYGRGRVFLLGDAAHLRWPKGGFGANTGIGDAVDLGWKLAAVLDGWGGPRLLESYETERRPIAVRNVNEASNNRMLDELVQPDPLLDRDGDEGTEARARLSNLLFAVRLREYQTDGIQLGYRYRDSQICIPDRQALEPPDDHMAYEPSTFPGCRAPHAWLSPGRSTLDLFGRGFALLRFAPHLPCDGLVQAAADVGAPLVVTDVASADIALLYEKKLVLVRPDGHVAWRSDVPPDGPRELLDRVVGR
jgi:2-polyprenyl-6-methoxyphenol hydroxylase-like FAD-dependent oxidoreductase